MVIKFSILQNPTNAHNPACLRYQIRQIFAFLESNLQSTIILIIIIKNPNIMSHKMPKLLLALMLLLVVSIQQQCMPGCTSCPTPHNCNTCLPNQQCCASTCQTCVNQTQCSQCSLGYSLNSTANLCYLTYSCKQSACNNCSNGTCTSCSGGNYLDQYTYQCVACPNNCAVCGAGGVCTSCVQMYYLTGGVCMACPQNCYLCSGPAVCTVCVQGFVASQGVCQQCIPNCQICNSTSTCMSCNTGYFINSQNQCSPCLQNCRACVGAANNCTQCLPGFNLVNSVCINCNAFIANCASCQQQGTTLMCLGCSPGYYVLKASQCLACPQNCLSCNSTTCFQCQIGYYPTAGQSQCQQCPQLGCLSCPGAVCSQCVLGTFLNPGTNTCQMCLDGCDVCASLSFCLQCSDDYFMQYGVCKACDFQCDQCSGTAANCLDCQIGFYQPSQYGYCIPCPEFCPNCTNSEITNSVVCLSCPYGTYLNANGNCTKCSLTNCISCDTIGTNICTLCNAGFFLSSNFCTPCPANCQICTSIQSCQACQTGFYLTANSTCQACPQNCALCSASACNQCNQNYFAKNNLCYKCPSQCKTCISLSQCLSCSEGFYLGQTNGLNSGQCLACDQSCKTCYLASDICTTCPGGYYLDFHELTCQACDSGCLICDGTVGCLVCKNGYGRMSNSTSIIENYFCTKCAQNCLNCTIIALGNGTYSNTCTQCNYGYTKGNNGACFPCGGTNLTVGCAVCTSDMVCQVCQDGLVLNEQKICIAETIDETKTNGLYIVLIVILSVSCAGLLGLIGFNLYKKNQENQGLYRQL